MARITYKKLKDAVSIMENTPVLDETCVHKWTSRTEYGGIVFICDKCKATGSISERLGENKNAREDKG